MKNFLTPEEKEGLAEEHLTLREKRLADRIKCIILLDKGFVYSKIAEILMLDDSTIRRYEELYQEGGIEKLLEVNYKGYEGKLQCDQLEELKQHLRAQLMRSAEAVTAWIEEKFDVPYTPEGMVHLLHKLGFSYKQTKLIPAKADSEKQKVFLEIYEEQKKSLGKNDKIYFVDAAHPQHNAMPAHAWIETGKEMPIPTNPGRKRLNLNGALEVQELEVIVQEKETINGTATVELLEEIEQKNPEAEHLYVISDNASYYHCQEVKEYLKTSKIEFLYLPPYSPNLNLIERLWKFFRKKVMSKILTQEGRGYYYEKFLNFREAALNFFKGVTSFYRKELKSLLTENFQILNFNTS